MNENEDMAICRIDYMKWSDMRKLHDLVNCVRNFASRNPNSDTENYIRHVVERMEEVFDYNLSDDSAYRIVLILRSLVSFVRTHRFEENDHEVIVVTGNIIKLVQGDNKMDKNQITAMTFRRVKEAIETVTVGNGPLPDLTDDRITVVSERYAAKIVADVFNNGKVIEQYSEFVSQYYEMDPETEDVLHNGTLVVDGMKVLLEDASCRVSIADNMSEEEIYNARRINRWCTVTESSVKICVVEPRLSFIAVYDDGTKAKRTEPVSTAWLVKKDSVPPVGDYKVIGPQNNVIYNGTLPEVLVRLDDMDEEAVGFYRVKAGSKKSVSTAKFLKDHTATFEVWDEEGSCVLSGTISRVLEWAKWLPGTEAADKYATYSVSRVGATDGYTLEQFVAQWEVK